MGAEGVDMPRSPVLLCKLDLDKVHLPYEVSSGPGSRDLAWALPRRDFQIGGEVGTCSGGVQAMSGQHRGDTTVGAE